MIELFPRKISIEVGDSQECPFYPQFDLLRCTVKHKNESKLKALVDNWTKIKVKFYMVVQEDEEDGE